VNEAEFAAKYNYSVVNTSWCEKNDKYNYYLHFLWHRCSLVNKAGFLAKYG